jgi:hypothetical protein
MFNVPGDRLKPYLHSLTTKERRREGLQFFFAVSLIPVIFSTPIAVILDEIFWVYLGAMALGVVIAALLFVWASSLGDDNPKGSPDDR